MKPAREREKRTRFADQALNSRRARRADGAPESIVSPATLEKARQPFWMAEAHASGRREARSGFYARYIRCRWQGASRQDAAGRRARISLSPASMGWPGSDIALGDGRPWGAGRGSGVLGRSLRKDIRGAWAHTDCRSSPRCWRVGATRLQPWRPDPRAGDGYESARRRGRAWRIPAGGMATEALRGVQPRSRGLTATPGNPSPRSKRRSARFTRASICRSRRLGAAAIPIRRTRPARHDVGSCGASELEMRAEPWKRPGAASCAAIPRPRRRPPGEWTILGGDLKTVRRRAVRTYWRRRPAAACASLQPSRWNELIGAIGRRVIRKPLKGLRHRAPRTASRPSQPVLCHRFFFYRAVPQVTSSGRLCECRRSGLGRMEQSVVIEATRRALSVARRSRSTSRDALAETVGGGGGGTGITGDPQMPMSKERLVASSAAMPKRHWASAPKHLVDFFIDGKPAVLARICLTLASWVPLRRER